MATYNDISLEEIRLTENEDVHREEDDDTPESQQEDVLKSILKNKKVFFQFLDTLPEPFKGKFDLKQVKKTYENANSFKVLVTGKTGSGKSTLTNGILGVTTPDQEIAEEGKRIGEPCTTEVTPYCITKGDVEITVWDSPGLQDSTDSADEYLQQMKDRCGERDLTLYCIDVRQPRFLTGNGNPDVVAMHKLTREFGPQFWSNAVIVLTFFNCIEDDIHIKYLKTEEEKTRAVKAKLQEWKDQIVQILVDDVKIDQQAAEKIVIVPAGYYSEPHLPVCEYWLSNLWNHCFAAISTQQGQLAFFKANFNRLKNEADVKDKDFKKKIGDQPIVNRAQAIREWFIKLWKNIKLKVTRSSRSN